MPSLVRSRPAPPPEKPAPKPKLRDQLFARLDALPVALQNDVRQVLKDAQAALDARGQSDAAAVQQVLREVQGKLEARIGEGLADMVTALVKLHTEFEEVKKRKPVAYVMTDVVRKDGQIVGAKFTPEGA